MKFQVKIVVQRNVDIVWVLCIPILLDVFIFESAWTLFMKYFLTGSFTVKPPREIIIA